MSFAEQTADVLVARRRGAILAILLNAGEYALNEGALEDALEAVGYPVSHATLRTTAGWLEEQGLVRIANRERNLWIVALTKTGEDVARGRSIVDGVKRPSPV